MNKFIITFVSFFFSVSLVLAQSNEETSKGVMKFEEETHDFGTFKEEKGKVTHSFTFVNKGDAPILISRVRTSCGCTTSGWSKEPILPGKKGFIKATYNPRNRPGNFMKVVRVTSNASKPLKVLRIKGNVVPRKKTVEELYPRKMDKLWLNNSNASFSTIKHTQVKIYNAKGYNSSDEKMKIAFKKIPKYLTVDLPKKAIEPKEKFTISLKYDASVLEDHWGFKTDKIPIIINGEKHPNHFLTVSATRIEDFSELTPEELKTASKIGMNDFAFNFGTIKLGETPEKVFKITNIGKSDLIIRKIDVTCDCTTVDLKDEVIPSNKQTTLTVKFDSNNRKGRQNKYVNLITNDPRRSQIRIRVSGIVTL